VWGAAGPDAFDCSGLVYAAYRSAGITLPRTAGDQWHATQPVQPSQETTGDLIFTRISGNDAGHMMMVVSAGGGVIHAGEAPQPATWSNSSTCRKPARCSAESPYDQAEEYAAGVLSTVGYERDTPIG
jgi:cell wall-associated NlpC family hydrolase